MSDSSDTSQLMNQLTALESEYETKRKAYYVMGDSVGWRSARAWLDHIEDCIRTIRQELLTRGETTERRCIVWHD